MAMIIPILLPHSNGIAFNLNGVSALVSTLPTSDPPATTNGTFSTFRPVGYSDIIVLHLLLYLPLITALIYRKQVSGL